MGEEECEDIFMEDYSILPHARGLGLLLCHLKVINMFFTFVSNLPELVSGQVLLIGLYG